MLWECSREERATTGRCQSRFEIGVQFGLREKIDRRANDTEKNKKNETEEVKKKEDNMSFRKEKEG